MAFIDTFAKYHTLSKYPVDENTSLANVRNKSGHTVTTSDIWASEIPAFFVVYDDDTRNSLAATEGDLCTQGSTLYEYKNGAWSVRNALVDGEVIGGIIKYHKGCKAVILTDTNNSGTGGNGYSVRIRPNSDTSGTGPFISSFISSMDKVVNGIPSVGYDPVVHDTTSSTGFRGEGTGTNDYIANCYGGVITFNTKRDQVDSQGNPTGNNAEITITIDCFEYIGEKLNTSITELAKKVESVTATAGEGVQAVTAAAETAGFSVSTKEITVEGEPDPISVKALDIDVAGVSSQGVITSGDENKLVTATGAQNIAGKVASAEIAAATLTTPDGSSDAIKDTTDTSKLVTAEQVKTYVTPLEQKVNDHLLDAAGKLEISVLADKLPKKPFFADEFSYVNSYGFEWEQLSNNIYTNKFEVKVAQSVSGLNEFKARPYDTSVLTPSSLGNGTCKLVIYLIPDGADKTAQVENAATKVAVSQANTFDTSTGIYTFNFDNQISLSAGGRYRIYFQNNDDTNALHCLPVIINSSSQGADVTKHETPTRYITGGIVDDYWGCWNTGAGQSNGVEQVAYGPKVSVSGLTLIPNEDGDTLELSGENGKIYLFPNGSSENQNVYDEYVWTNNTWEKIGSTKVDLSGYVNSIANANGVSGTVTGNVATIKVQDGTTTQKGIVQLASQHEASNTTKAATGATVNAAISGIAEANKSDNGVKVTTKGGSVTGVTVNTTSIVNNDALVESVTGDNLITAADALAAIRLAKPENYVASVTGYTTTGAEVTTTQGAAIKVSDGRTTVYPNDLWGTTVSMVGNTITVQSNPIDGITWGPKNGYNTKGMYLQHSQGSKPITKVENNKVYNGTTEVANIKTNELVNGSGMFAQTSLESFSGDLSSLVDGNYMFYNTSLTSFNGALRSLTDGDSMFMYSSLESFSGDLRSLVNGYNMFNSTSLISFDGDLRSLVNGYWMFYDTSLTSFSGDLSSLVNGDSMFWGTSLTSFSGDLSSLVNGNSMFYNTSLTSFSGDLSSLVNGNSMFYNTSLTSFNGDLSSLVAGNHMFAATSLTSFNGDLSNLVYSNQMFYYTKLESFNNDLSSLIFGTEMFMSSSLESFNGDLSSLVDGKSMLSGCHSLKSFSGDLSSLVNGKGMFHSTSLDVESVELICDVLPNYNTEKLQTATWNESGENKGKYTYSDWESGDYYYPIIKITNNINADSTDGIDRSFGTEHIIESDVKTITIYWNSDSAMLDSEHEADRTAITKLFTDTANEKGWTFITNTELGGTVSPNAVMAADGTIQYYVLAKKDEATEDNATHIDASGKLWKFDTAEAIIGPNIKYWSMFATVEDALTEWELTPWTKPTEEEAEA